MRILRNVTLVILTLVVISILLLRTSKVQTYLTSKISSYLSEQLDTKISIDRVDISWFLDLELEGALMEDQKGNPLLSTAALKVDMNVFKFFKRKILVKNVHLVEPTFAYRKYPGEEFTNLQFLLDFFKSDDTDTTASEPWDIQVTSISVENAEFIYDTGVDTYLEGFDANHLHLQNITGSFNNLYYPGDSLFIRIEDLSAIDRSGLEVNNFTTDFIIASGKVILPDFKVHTNQSTFQGEALFKFKDTQSWSNFITDIKLDINLDSSYVSMEDLVFFSPSLEGMTDKFLVDGRIKGTIDKLKGKDILLAFDHQNWFLGDLKLHGLPDVEHSFIMINSDKLRVNPVTLANLRLPGGNRLELPSEVNRLGKIRADGRFTGFLNDFVANMRFRTQLGQISTDISLMPLPGKNDLAYEGKIATKDLNVNQLLQTDRFGKITMSGTVKGEGLNISTTAKANLHITSVEMNNGVYQDIELNAHLEEKVVDFDLVSSDNRFLLDSEGSYNFGLALPEGRVTAHIKNARVSRMLLQDADTLGEISTTIHAQVRGNSLDNFVGDIQLDSTSYAFTEDFFVEKLIFQTDIKDSVRNVFLTSDYVDVNVKGIKDIQELEQNIQYVLDRTLPSLLQDSSANKTFLANAQGVNNLDIKVNLKETALLNMLFLSNMELAAGTLIESKYDAPLDKLQLEVTAPHFSYGEYVFQNINIEANKENKLTKTEATISTFILSDSIQIDSIELQSTIALDTIFYHFHAGRHHNHTIQANMGGRFSIMEQGRFELEFNDASFWLSDTLFQIQNDNKLWFSSNEIGAKDFILYSKGSSVHIDGEVNKQLTDSLKVNFTNFDLNHADRYTQAFYTDFDGTMNGELILNNIYDYVDFLSEIEISQFKLNDVYLGTTHLNTTWNKKKDAAAVDLAIENKHHKPFRVYGYYFPSSKKDNYSLTLDLDKFPAHALEPYVASFSSDLKGLLNGQIAISGPTAAPEFKGEALMDISKFKIDYLNTFYAFKDKIYFTPTKISFKDVKFYDQNYHKGDRNTAVTDFSLTHDKFQDIAIDLLLKPNRMMCLNTTSKDNDMFYGTAFGSGDVHISGPLTNLNFDVEVETKLGTTVSIPITSGSDATKADFVNFITIDTTQVQERDVVVDEDGTEYKITMDLLFKLRPSATIQIVMNEANEEAIKARGTGDIRMTIDEDENVAMYGTFEIAEGNVETFGKKFEIDNGSRITWDGDIEEAKLDIRAIHTVQADIADLIEGDSTKQLTDVQCIINISGDLYSPQIMFDIQTPDLESFKKDQVQNYLSIGGEKSQDIINRNFIYLLFMAQFQPQQLNSATSGEGGEFSNSAKSVTDLISSQISNQLNRVTDAVDIGVELSTEDVKINLSRTLFDDKLLIYTQVGSDFSTSGTNTSADDEGGSTLVPEVKVEYKIDENLRVRAYNKTNYDVTEKAGYTQGVGIVWRKEFDSFNIFKKKKEEKDKEKKEEPTKESDPKKAEESNKTSKTNTQESPK